MYRSFDDEVFPAPESIVATIVATAAIDDDLDLPGVVSLGHLRHGGDADFQADPHHVDPGANTKASATIEAARIDAWAGHARGANGFGG